MKPMNNEFLFPSGLPGLPEDLKKFSLCAISNDSPFFYLESFEDENIGFFLINPFTIYHDYEFELSDEEVEYLNIQSQDHIAVFCIINASRGLKDATLNLLAPIVVNTENGKARQIVLNDKRYNVRHPMPFSAKAAGEEVDKNAGTD